LLYWSEIMPGSVSDSYDCEFGTGEAASQVKEAMQTMHERLGKVIGGPPKYIVDVVNGECGKDIRVTLTEREWRFLRFACERAVDSL
jgi:hypothetical protein